MCGIAGIYAYHYAANPVDGAELRRVREHGMGRGRGAAGEWLSPDRRVGLGLTGGDGGVFLSSCGDGHDSSALLGLYRRHGPDLLAELRGAYAFALWDAARQILLMARDPGGLEPLFYYDDGWTLRVASHPHALGSGALEARELAPGHVVQVGRLGTGAPRRVATPARRPGAPARRGRVLALVADAFGGEGGIARFNRDLIGALAAMPEVERVDVLCRHAPRRQEALPAKVVQTRAAGGRVGYALTALARAAFGPRHDVVLCSHLHLAPVAATAAALLRAPLWVHLHGIESWQRPGPLRAKAMRRATLVTAISRYTRRRFLEWADVDPHRVRVLPSTVNARFTPGPRPEALAERLGVQGRRVLLTVSRIDRGDRYKGHDKVLGALKALADSRPDLDYVIAGDGDDRGRLEALARELGVAHRVHFVGHVGDSELLDYYRLADVFIMPSAKEGFGIVFLEAVASGLPVIGGAGDGTRDALADGQLGALVDPDRAGQLCEAIEAALDAPRGATSAARFDAAHFGQHVRGLAALLAAPDA